MNITKAQVIRGRGADKVLLTTDLPDPICPFQGDLALKFETAADTGVEYVRKHFGLEAVLVEVPSAFEGVRMNILG